MSGSFNAALRRHPMVGGSCAILLLLVPAGTATADTCSALRAQLAALGGSGGEHAGSVSQELKKLRTRALWGGCVAGGPAVAIRSRDCPAILARLSQLQRGGRQRQTVGTAATRQTEKQRARLLRALARNACDDGGGDAAMIPVWSRAFRTLCVRACDGYYFPIGTATPRSRLKFDEAACKSMYFGKEAELYVHAPGSPADTARSVRGRRYTDLPAAFAFRSSLDPSCVAEIREGLAALARVMPPPKIAVRRKPPPTAVARRAPPVPAPRLRAPVHEDPETQANAAGHFDLADDGNGRIAFDPTIRKLGPAYYYADRGPGLFADIRPVEKSPPPLFEFVGSAAATERTN